MIKDAAGHQSAGELSGRGRAYRQRQLSLGLLKDRELVDGVITRGGAALHQRRYVFDDAPPTGPLRFVTQTNMRGFVWEGRGSCRSEGHSRRRPALAERADALWWDLVFPDGYGYAWGRIMGVVSYMDTMESSAFSRRILSFPAGAARAIGERLLPGMAMAAA